MMAFRASRQVVRQAASVAGMICSSSASLNSRVLHLNPPVLLQHFLPQRALLSVRDMSRYPRTLNIPGLTAKTLQILSRGSLGSFGKHVKVEEVSAGPESRAWRVIERRLETRGINVSSSADGVEFEDKLGARGRIFL